MLYPRANSQAGERGKKPIDRFGVRNLKVQVKAALPSSPTMGTAGRTGTRDRSCRAAGEVRIQHDARAEHLLG